MKVQGRFVEENGKRVLRLIEKPTRHRRRHTYNELMRMPRKIGVRDDVIERAVRINGYKLIVHQCCSGIVYFLGSYQE